MATKSPSPRSAVEIEQRLLETLCSASITAGQWQACARELASHNWQAPDHAVVFQALLRLRRADGRFQPQELPAQATRLGFPDIDWTPYLLHPTKKAKSTRDRLVGLMRRLKAATLKSER
jgi:hypothetical protein